MLFLYVVLVERQCDWCKLESPLAYPLLGSLAPPHMKR